MLIACLLLPLAAFVGTVVVHAVIVALMVYTIRYSTWLAHLLLPVVRVLVWRVVEYNKGAWAAPATNRP